jgi:transposase-like protein
MYPIVYFDALVVKVRQDGRVINKAIHLALDARYPTISKSWMTHWERIIPFFAFPTDIRKAIYTTNAIESLNMILRKVLRNHRSFPTDESAMKVVFLAINNLSKKWTMPIRDWKSALNRFAIEFEGRFPM